eukprot:scaffold95082_cov51-Phaeocystis_antarctica.AAC.1
MAEVDPLGDSRLRHSFHPRTRPSLSSWSSRAYWPIGSPITGRQEPCMEKPARRWLAAARCAVPQVHVVYVPAAPAPPGSHRTRGQCDPARRRSDARPPEVAQESTH